MRYKLIPSLIAAGHAATTAGFPIVARGDLFWPTHTEAANNTQYIHLNDTLVAPIWDSTNNMTTRSVWIPPGDWQDAWDGSVVTGPQTTTVTKPYEQIPMWHRKGSFMVTVDSPARRVEDQDWSVLTLEVFPDMVSKEIQRRSVYSLGSAARTDLTMETIGEMGLLIFQISPSEDGASRGWLVRLHLLPGQYCAAAIADGMNLIVSHINPVSETDTLFPFGGAGTPPAHRAGKIAEVLIPSGDSQRFIKISIVDY